jgi:hypothetical protein
MSAEQHRLLQAIQHFSARTRGAELPKGVPKALEGLQKALGQPMPGHDTPGAKAALKAAPGTGSGPPTGAAKGSKSTPPGQQEATVSEAIQRAAEKAVAEISGNAA